MKRTIKCTDEPGNYSNLTIWHVERYVSLRAFRIRDAMAIPLFPTIGQAEQIRDALTAAITKAKEALQAQKFERKRPAKARKASGGTSGRERLKKSLKAVAVK